MIFAVTVEILHRREEKKQKFTQFVCPRIAAAASVFFFFFFVLSLIVCWFDID